MRKGGGQWSAAAVVLVTVAMTKAEIAAARARTVAMAAANVMATAVLMAMAVGMAMAVTVAALREMALVMQ